MTVKKQAVEVGLSPSGGCAAVHGERPRRFESPPAAQISPPTGYWAVRLYILVTRSMPRSERYHDRVNRVLDYISENLAGELSLTDCPASAVSPLSISTAFFKVLRARR